MAGRILLGLVSFICVVAGAAWIRASAAEAQQMRATMHSDGLACPGNCDAHVVFAQRHNGTPNAFRPPLASCSVLNLACAASPDHSSAPEGADFGTQVTVAPAARVVRAWR